MPQIWPVTAMSKTPMYLRRLSEAFDMLTPKKFRRKIFAREDEEDLFEEYARIFGKEEKAQEGDRTGRKKGNEEKKDYRATPVIASGTKVTKSG